MQGYYLDSPLRCRHGASGGQTGHEHTVRINIYSEISLVIPAIMTGPPSLRNQFQHNDGFDCR
jgi:hypothetical protein